MRSCREITTLVSQGLDKPLTWRERLSIRFHFMMCSSCANFEKQAQFMRKAAHSYTEQLQTRLNKKS